MTKIIFFFLIKTIINQELDLSIFTSQICSFNGKLRLNRNENSQIKYYCICDEQFENDENIRNIYDNKVYCSYKKKSKLITLFFAIFFPFGFDYFYLGYSIYSILIFLYSLFVLIANIFFLYKFIDFENKINENTINNEEKTKMEKFQMIIKFLDLLSFVFYILNICLISLDVINDSYGKTLFNDINFYKNK